MKIINIGILAHVDAGKTTLTESLLYTSGAIAEQGNVDKGTTRTDTMILEQQRGITIQTAVTSFCWNDYKINIVDTPGHMDFLTEAYRSLSVLDGEPAICQRSHFRTGERRKRDNEDGHHVFGAAAWDYHSSGSHFLPVAQM